MDDQQKDQKVFRQNLDEKGSFQTLFQIYLLFTEKGTRALKTYQRILKEVGAYLERIGIPAPEIPEKEDSSLV